MSPHQKPPLVTVGMPVYNESGFIAETLDTLLQQTYPHLEILIADNGSTDGTSEICAAYAARYPHITSVRHAENIGANANFNFLARKASGTYFCWVSGHDLLAPDCIEKSVAVLQGDLSIVLAYPRTMNMKVDRTPTREKVRPFAIDTMGPARRFAEVMWRVDCNYVYGIWRMQSVRESKLFRPVPAADRVFLAEMAIKGTFAPVDTFKYYRMNRAGVETEMQKRHRLMRYIFPQRVFTDAALAGNAFYVPTQEAFRSVVREGHFPWWITQLLFLSIWLSGVMKYHLFPGADLLSDLCKKILPRRVLQWMLHFMQ